MPETGSLHEYFSLPENHNLWFPAVALAAILPSLPWGDVGRVLAALAVYYAPTLVRRWSRLQYTPIYFAAYSFQGISVEFSIYFPDHHEWEHLPLEVRQQKNRALVRRSILSAFFDGIIVPLIAGAVTAWFLSPRQFSWTLGTIVTLKVVEVTKSALDFYIHHPAERRRIWLLVLIYATYVMVSLEMLRLAYWWTNPFVQRDGMIAFLSAVSSFLFGKIIAAGLVLAVITTIFSEYILGSRFPVSAPTAHYPPLEFRDHLYRSRKWVEQLLDAGYGRPDVIALLLVETYFRPTWVRKLEYTLMPILRRVAADRYSRLTVGMAQLQRRHWQRFARNLSPRDFEDPITNYEACRTYLAWHGVELETEPTELTSRYTGSFETFYTRLFQAAKEWVVEVAEEAEKTRLRRSSSFTG